MIYYPLTCEKFEEEERKEEKGRQVERGELLSTVVDQNEVGQSVHRVLFSTVLG